MMQWNVDVFEQEVRAYPYFQRHGFTFAGRDVSKPGTDHECHEIMLQNPLINRSLEITFAPPTASGKPAVSQLWVVNLSTDDAFSLEDYIKQHHGVDVDAQGSLYTNYSGTFQERVRAYLEFVTDLLAKYVEPTLKGLEWPQVDFDWDGYR